MLLLTTLTTYMKDLNTGRLACRYPGVCFCVGGDCEVIQVNFLTDDLL